MKNKIYNRYTPGRGNVPVVFWKFQKFPENVIETELIFVILLVLRFTEVGLGLREQ